jgi:bacteriorhodopsin
MGRMMDGYHNFMGGYAGSYGFFSVLSVVGLVSGILMIVGAAMLRARPREHVLWGTIILVFSVVSFVGMGGFFIGAVLGIVGGAFAIIYRPRAETPSS